MAASPRESRPRSRARRASGSRFSGRLFAGIFALAFGIPGAALTWFLLVQPVIQIVAARGWEPAICVITSSAVEASTSSDSDTYSVEIRYTYEIAGQTYNGDRYNFGGPGKSSGYESKRAIVDSLPVGAETDCWFDPDDPSRSVIVRGAGKFLFWGLLPLPFLLVGLGAAFVFVMIPKAERLAAGGSTSRRPAVHSPTTRSASVGFEPETNDVSLSVRQVVQRHVGDLSDRPVDASVLGIEADPIGGLALEPVAGRKARVIGLLFVALFWNGIVSIFLWQVGIFQGSIDDGCLAIFLIPFVLVGIALIVAFLHQLLNLANPLPHLRLSTPRPTPGQSAMLEYRLTGATHRISSFSIRLRGKESATYRRGTDTSTDSHVFYDRELVSLNRIGGGFGTVDFEWPADAMPTFKAPNNEVSWSLSVHGDIRFWPDVAEDFQVPIYPPETVL